MRKDYWLVTTEHLKDRLWFKDEEDFKVGMNYVAVMAASIPVVEILAFILMSNHVHFVVGGTEIVVAEFINRFKLLYSKYFTHKYSSKELLRNNKADFKLLDWRDESMERAIAYVQMNSVAANICLQPSGYPWGTGSIFFNKTAQTGVQIGSVSIRLQRKTLHSKTTLPPNYILDERGFISPMSYAKIQLVEQIFRTPNRMNYFLQNSSRIRKSSGTAAPTFSDQVVLSAMLNLCTSVFHKSSLNSLDGMELAQLLNQLRYRFSADSKQLARVTGIEQERVLMLLDTFIQR